MSRRREQPGNRIENMPLLRNRTVTAPVGEPGDGFADQGDHQFV
jgi:hypothetical protein